MASLSRISLIGRLGTDVESKYTPQGTLIASFRMAVNVRHGGNETTNWHSCSLFGKLAETALNLAERGYLGKGKEVYIEGSFIAREYEHNGQQRTSLDVNVRDFQLLGQRESVDPDAQEIPF